MTDVFVLLCVADLQQQGYFAKESKCNSWIKNIVVLSKGKMKSVFLNA